MVCASLRNFASIQWANESVDMELLPLRSSYDHKCWVSMPDVRRYQQDTYTFNVRMRRGLARENCL